ncbi:MAG: hypothetical protein A4E30_00809 [Methanomassiliicoccales archaeon PtaB.Bin215]|nr:MAG: hypothetical protein A4E30_00809 [Methanomassiliicoccales archaeon PtaB.Bin215]
MAIRNIVYPDEDGQHHPAFLYLREAHHRGLSALQYLRSAPGGLHHQFLDLAGVLIGGHPHLHIGLPVEVGGVHVHYDLVLDEGVGNDHVLEGVQVQEAGGDQSHILHLTGMAVAQRHPVPGLERTVEQELHSREHVAEGVLGGITYDQSKEPYAQDHVPQVHSEKPGDDEGRYHGDGHLSYQGNSIHQNVLGIILPVVADLLAVAGHHLHQYAVGHDGGYDGDDDHICQLQVGDRGWRQLQYLQGGDRPVGDDEHGERKPDHFYGDVVPFALGLTGQAMNGRPDHLHEPQSDGHPYQDAETEGPPVPVQGGGHEVLPHPHYLILPVDLAVQGFSPEDYLVVHLTGFEAVHVGDLEHDVQRDDVLIEVGARG